MKTAFLVTALLLLSWGCFAQILQKPILTTPPAKKQLPAPLFSQPKPNLRLKQFSAPGLNLNKFPRQTDIGPNAGFKKKTSSQLKHNMPVLKPDSSFRYPMLAVKPDSTVRYYLRIKQPE